MAELCSRCHSVCRHILGASPASDLSLSTAQEGSQQDSQKSRESPVLATGSQQQHRGVDSSGTSSSCACNSHSQEPAAEDVTEHQGCQQAPASTFPFKPLPCTPCVLSICLPSAKNKEVGRCAFSSFHTTHEAVYPQSYRLYWVNQNTSGIFTLVLSEGLHW